MERSNENAIETRIPLSQRVTFLTKITEANRKHKLHVKSLHWFTVKKLLE